MSDEPVAIALDHVSKRYGDGPEAVHALTEVSLEIPAAQFVAVMGPSGSGKSTMLNLIAGIDTATSGRVEVAGRDLGRLSDDARSDLRLEKMGFVFQNFNLLPTFTVEENVAWPLEFLGVRPREAQKRAAAALERVGVDSGTRRRSPAQMSGGEQQRISIARALVTEPVLLLCDEPTGNLDSRNGQAILELLRALNRERSLTVVLVTHNTYAATYGHRVLEIEDGRVVSDVSAPAGPPRRVIPLRPNET